MRNLKKILALVLALVMSFSLMATANAFTDSKDIDDTFEEAVEVLSALEVFQGYENGSFQPQGEITRAEVATIIYRIVTGDVTDKQVGIYADYNKFDDVKSGSWYAGYVNFCANAEIVKGRDAKTFDPNGKVTGYEALAMILRAIGYDKNGEFTGSGWQVQTAAVGKKLGITNNISAGTLGGYATREVVAEILFQTILVDQVTYTPALSYVLKGDSLGYETFKLVGAVAGEDVWGRPAKVWKLDKDSDKVAETTDTTLVSLAYDPAASYTVKVDECDIANDLGITKAAAIEAAYIDGVKTTVTNQTVTTDRNGKIDPLATTSLVGGQGRLTEVYDMGDGTYRLVEINTYLANVTKVTPTYTDRNGHVTAATIDLNVWQNATGTTTVQYPNVPATGFSKGDYVLVQITLDDGVVRSVELATSTAAGTMKSWTPAYGTVAPTTTMANDTYNDADKFILGNVKPSAGSWDAFVDQYGNLIGLIPSAKSYLVVESISWKQDGTVTRGGRAVADVILADGTRADFVTVASVNGATTTNKNDTLGVVNGAQVSDDWTNNTAYYNHIYAYSVNADGAYALEGYCGQVSATGYKGNHNTAAVVINTGKTSTIQNNTNTVVANNNTVFLVKQANGTYDVYYGVNNVPSMTVAQYGMCYLTDGVYATLVVITNYTLASSSFVAYADKQSGLTAGYNPLIYSYTVYQAGSTEPTFVYSTNANLFTADGFYKIEVDASNKVLAGYPVGVIGTYDNGTDAYSSLVSGANLSWDRAYVKACDGDSLVATYLNGNVFADYRVNPTSTQYFEVLKTIYSDGTVRTRITNAVDSSSLNEGDRVVVAYTGTGSDKVAAYVYVLKTEQWGQSTPSTTGSINYYVTLKNSQGVTFAENVLVATQSGLADGTVYNNVNWSFLQGAVANPASAAGTFTVKNNVSLAGYLSVDNYNNVVIVAGETIELHYTAILP